MPVFSYAQAQEAYDSLSFAEPEEHEHIVVTPQQTEPIIAARHKDGTRIYGDSAIYQGMSFKLDLGNTTLELARSKAKIISTEVAMNWRLINRYFPTFELGYAQAACGAEGGQHIGQGGFFRAGLDLNPLKKHPERENVILVGLRVGCAMQQFSLEGVTQHVTDYWNTPETTWDYNNVFKADAWGEIVAGCQVQVWEGLQMGWYVRMKFLFTRKDKNGGPLPYYIPGFGYRDDTTWGLNYYIGYKF